MNKTIEITVSPSGQTRIETRGFTGTDCRAASQFIEQALGSRVSEQLTSAFYQTESTQNTTQEHA